MPTCVTYACSRDRLLLFYPFTEQERLFSNTQERKPVTNSRDTQELPPDAGQDMLRIFHTHPARTSLLQDFAFYEVMSCNSFACCLTRPNLFQLQSIQRMQAHAAGGPTTNIQSPPSPQTSSPSPPVPQQQAFGLTNPNNLAFSQLQLQQMSPMMQMQMQMGFPLVNTQTIQSLMRNPSPVPGQGFTGGVPGFPS